MAARWGQDAVLHDTHEFFTPSELLIRINNWLDQFDKTVFSIEKTFIDHSCGDGQILSEVMIRKIENLAKTKNSTEISVDEFRLILSSIYGVELMIDNVDLCRDRLLCGQTHLRYIVEQNIYQANALRFSYEFCPMAATRNTRENKLRKKSQIEAQFENLFKLVTKKKSK